MNRSTKRCAGCEDARGRNRQIFILENPMSDSGKRWTLEDREGNPILVITHISPQTAEGEQRRRERTLFTSAFHLPWRERTLALAVTHTCPGGYASARECQGVPGSAVGFGLVGNHQQKARRIFKMRRAGAHH